MSTLLTYGYDDTSMAMPDGRRVSHDALRKMLPTIEIALLFGKVYHLSAKQLGELLLITHRTTLVEALVGEGAEHSAELQDYLVEITPPDVLPELKVGNPQPINGELLTHLWEDAMVEVASSIQQVADKLTNVIGQLPSKQGEMVFRALNVAHRNRPTIGDYRAHIQHRSVPDVAVVLDVSGSMSERTIRTIIKDVVALSWKANAHLIIVSNNAFHWEPGAYDVDSVLAKCEYGGTQYESLAPLFNKDWGTVVTIADYDSSPSAKRVLNQCKGRIGQVLDVSLVNRSTYLAECLGQLATKVRPLLVAKQDLTYSW